jgi:hypothetical protein
MQRRRDWHADFAVVSLRKTAPWLREIAALVARQVKVGVGGPAMLLGGNGAGFLWRFCAMENSFEQVLVAVWRQVLVEECTSLDVEGKRYAVRQTPKSKLRQVDFVFDGEEIRGLEQNPETKSRWAQMARSGKKVMQFLSHGRYVGNVVDGKATVYGGRREG